MSSFKEIEIQIQEVESKTEFRRLLQSLRVMSSNSKNKTVINLIDKALKKSILINDEESRIILLGLKIAQIYHLEENRKLSFELLNEMKHYSETSKDKNGLAFTLMFEWLLERRIGNDKKSSKAIQNAVSIIETGTVHDEYIRNMCYYSLAVEKWFGDHDPSSADIFEKCANYFWENGFYRSYIQTLSLLVSIYTRLQNGQKILESCKKIFGNRSFFEKLPLDLRALSYYYVGLGYMIDLNLRLAEKYFEEAFNIFKNVYRESIYFGYYLVMHSFITTVKALQGKMEQTRGMIIEAEKLLQEELFSINLDAATKKQIHHTLNLNKFYVYSRLKGFNPEKMSDLIIEIYNGSKTLYSDFMLLSEFILNSNLDTSKLRQLLKTDNYSINRVKHLILFDLTDKNKGRISERRLNKRIEVVTERTRTSKTAFIEDVLADLLIAQQLHSLKRYTEISNLLRKYEGKLDQIQVLELRLFMEAFIQIGVYRNGNPLGLVFHYTAIRKCNSYGFTRLETRLSEYLEMQKREAMPWLRGKY